MRFWHTLALALGMSVARAQQEISSLEFARWRILYEEFESFGEYRADLRNGILCSLLAAAHGVKNPKPADFMPYLDKEVVKQSEAAQAAAVGQIAQVMGVIKKQKQ